MSGQEKEKGSIKKMNFKNHESDLKQLLQIPVPGRKKFYHKGCYIIQRDAGDLSYKIGMSWGKSGLLVRLRSYKICFPYVNEFYVKYLVLSSTSDDAKMLEKRVLAQRKLKHIEKNPTAQGRRSNEYRFTSSAQVLKNVLKRVLDANPNIWTHLILFGENGWKLIPNLGHAVRDLSAPSNRITAMPTPF